LQLSEKFGQSEIADDDWRSRQIVSGIKASPKLACCFIDALPVARSLGRLTAWRPVGFESKMYKKSNFIELNCTSSIRSRTRINRVSSTCVWPVAVGRQAGTTAMNHARAMHDQATLQRHLPNSNSNSNSNHTTKSSQRMRRLESTGKQIESEGALRSILMSNSNKQMMN